MSWRAAVSLPGDNPDVEVGGKHRVLIDSNAPPGRPSAPTQVDSFLGPALDPAWAPLGPAGIFVDRGGYRLVYRERLAAPTRGPNAPTLAAGGEYTDGKGVYTRTDLWSLPVAGLYRIVPPQSFEATVRFANVQWAGDSPALKREFWDAPDMAYRYGPKYTAGVSVAVQRLKGEAMIVVSQFRDGAWIEIGREPLPAAPATVELRANWREARDRWPCSPNILLPSMILPSFLTC